MAYLAKSALLSYGEPDCALIETLAKSKNAKIAKNLLMPKMTVCFYPKIALSASRFPSGKTRAIGGYDF